jgi:NAD(P)-dependent dehydrogenase (short-subunit alcohol dehydrogenase family)
MNFQKTIIVTGSTSGIGLSIIEKFYEENFNCIIVGTAKS